MAKRKRAKPPRKSGLASKQKLAAEVEKKPSPEHLEAELIWMRTVAQSLHRHLNNALQWPWAARSPDARMQAMCNTQRGEAMMFMRNMAAMESQNGDQRVGGRS